MLRHRDEFTPRVRLARRSLLAEVAGVTCNGTYDITMPWHNSTSPSTYCVKWQVRPRLARPPQPPSRASLAGWEVALSPRHLAPSGSQVTGHPAGALNGAKLLGVHPLCSGCSVSNTKMNSWALSGLNLRACTFLAAAFVAKPASVLHAGAHRGPCLEATPLSSRLLRGVPHLERVRAPTVRALAVPFASLQRRTATY